MTFELESLDENAGIHAYALCYRCRNTESSELSPTPALYDGLTTFGVTGLPSDAKHPPASHFSQSRTSK